MRNVKKICTTAKIDIYTALYGRPMRTKLPELRVNRPSDAPMRAKDQKSKDTMKQYADRRRHTKILDLQTDDKVLVHKGKIHQRKTDSYYEPQPYTIVEKKGSMITASNGNHSITRNSSMFKPVKVEKLIDNRATDSDEDIDLMVEPENIDSGEQPAQEERRYPMRTTRGKMPTALKDFEV